MKKRITILGAVLLSAVLLSGCQGKTENMTEETMAETTEEAKEAALLDGTYQAVFDTDSSMFRVTEAHGGKGILTVKDGEMSIHVSLNSKNIVNLYPGLAEDAKKDGAVWLEPTVDSVTYRDGWTEDVYGYDIPVPVLNEEFDLALIGKKGKWYDHKVTVSDPKPYTESKKKAEELADGVYSIELTMEGGSGKAELLSHAMLTVLDGSMTATVEWNSPNYDYMIVNEEKYLPVNDGGNSVFELPVLALDVPIEVIGDTIAMSKPHEVEYTVTFHSETMTAFSELHSEGYTELEYAKNFTIERFEGGYRLLTLMDGTKLLTVPEGMSVPENLGDEIILISQPVQDLYLVSSSVMNMFSALDALDSISLSAQKAENWYIEDAKAAMDAGNIVYAGKYSKPDYELILSKGCSLAIENRMISHSPEVLEKLESFGIPAMIEYSSYEAHPLGRVEWIKFFGALLGKEEKAQELFEEQSEILARVTAKERTDQTVAFFFITSNGLVQVRTPDDYVAKMIELAGGTYIYSGSEIADSGRSTMNVQLEEFYNTARDADYLIYNSSINGGMTSLDELMEKSELFADFKAVKNGNVWCTTNDMYQQSMAAGYMIEDIYQIMTKKDITDEELTYLFRLR